MDTELLKQSWAKLTKHGYTLSSPAPGEHHYADGLLNSDSIEAIAQLYPIRAVNSHNF